jgi:hypothetical protein
LNSIISFESSGVKASSASIHKTQSFLAIETPYFLVSENPFHPTISYLTENFLTVSSVLSVVKLSIHQYIQAGIECSGKYFFPHFLLL